MLFVLCVPILVLFVALALERLEKAAARRRGGPVQRFSGMTAKLASASSAIDALGLTIAVRDYDDRGLLINPLACTGHPEASQRFVRGRLQRRPLRDLSSHPCRVRGCAGHPTRLVIAMPSRHRTSDS
jgi:hypothetical protein